MGGGYAGFGRAAEARDELHRMLSEDELRNAVRRAWDERWWLAAIISL